MYLFIYVIIGCINFSLMLILNKRLGTLRDPNASIAKKSISLIKLIIILIVLWPLFFVVQYSIYRKIQKVLKGSGKSFFASLYTREL